MNRIIIPITIGVFLLTGCGTLKKTEQTETDKASPVRLKVEVTKAVRQELQQKRLFTGVLEPLKQVDLAPATQGAVIRRITVDIGSRVKKGELLAELDDAQLATTRARFDPLKAQYERLQRLYQSNAVSKTQYDQVESEYLALKRQLEQIEENTYIHAPFSGTITGKYFEAGELYMPSMGRGAGLVQLTQLDPLKLDLSMDESSVAHVSKDQKVSLVIGALGDSAFTGTIQWINPSADPVSHTFSVRILVPNRNNVLRAGYFAEVAIVMDSRDDVVSVPADALVGKRIYIIHNDSIALSREVSTGWRTSESVEILSGVKEGDIVVVAGNKALPDSSIVIIE